MKATATIFLVMLITLCTVSHGQTVHKFELRYIPFQAETLIAITPKTIAQLKPYLITNQDEVVIRREFGHATVVENDTFAFQNGKVRLMITIDDTAYVCDSSGSCFSDKFDTINVNVNNLTVVLQKYVDEQKP